MPLVPGSSDWGDTTQGLEETVVTDRVVHGASPRLHKAELAAAPAYVAPRQNPTPGHGLSVSSLSASGPGPRGFEPGALHSHGLAEPRLWPLGLLGNPPALHPHCCFQHEDSRSHVGATSGRVSRALGAGGRCR